MSRAYVSYSWAVEAATGVVADIQRYCDEHKVELVLDKREVDYGDSIPEFMEKIGQARWVFVVLSEEYFRSEYCMFEMLRVFECGEVDSRVQAVLLDRTWLEDDRRGLFSRELETHWRDRQVAERTKGLDAEKKGAMETAEILNRRADFFASIAKRVAEFLQHFADLRLDPLGENRQAVLTRLVKRVMPTRNLRTDAQFVEEIGGRLDSMMASAKLSAALEAAKKQSGFPMGESVRACAVKDPAQFIRQVLKPAFESLKSDANIKAREYRTLWDAGTRVLSYVMLLAVSNDWVRDGRISPETEKIWEIVAKSDFTVEVVSARVRQFPHMNIEADNSKNVVRGSGSIEVPRPKTGWGDGSGLNTGLVNATLVSVWNGVFPGAKERKEGTTELNADELETLKTTLDVREEARSAHYYLHRSMDRVSNEADRNSLRRAMDEVVAQLPSLSVFLFSGVGGADILVCNEIQLRVYAMEFLALKP